MKSFVAKEIAHPTNENILLVHSTHLKTSYIAWVLYCWVRSTISIFGRIYSNDTLSNIHVLFYKAPPTTLMLFENSAHTYDTAARKCQRHSHIGVGGCKVKDSFKKKCTSDTCVLSTWEALKPNRVGMRGGLETAHQSLWWTGTVLGKTAFFPAAEQGRLPVLLLLIFQMENSVSVLKLVCVWSGQVPFLSGLWSGQDCSSFITTDTSRALLCMVSAAFGV